MTTKEIKTEQWTVKILINKIKNKEITKPQFQRKKKWHILPKNNNTPNEYSYIKFLFNNKHSVDAITFGLKYISNGPIYSNIDGNNRINAIKHFIDKPFEIFSEYLNDLFKFLDDSNMKHETKEFLKTIFSKLSYDDIIEFQYKNYFIENGYKELYDNELQIHRTRDKIEDHIEVIKSKLKVNNERFDSIITISVNIFIGHTLYELAKIFESINQYKSKLTETELLSCALYKVSNFTISDETFKTELKKYIKDYYETKSSGEALDCYKFNSEDNINAHDFIIGFQNLCNKKYTFISKSSVDGLSLFFKLYKILYHSFDNTFTSKNVNNFIKYIKYSCEILEETMSNIFTKEINAKLFNKSCKNKLSAIKKNNLFLILCSIIGFKMKNTDKEVIINSLKISLLYHFFIGDLNSKDTKAEYYNKDIIYGMSGKSLIDNNAKKLLSNPENISSKINQSLFRTLINELIREQNKPDKRKLPSGKNKNDKRRLITFFEKTLMFYYYKTNLPTKMLDNNFSIEHIIPNSSEWEGEIAKDRTGNLIPIISEINCSRGNKHINTYYKHEISEEFFRFMEVIPNDNEYDSIICHNNRKPKIKDNQKYNEMCKKNEQIYINSFINYLF